MADIVAGGVRSDWTWVCECLREWMCGCPSVCACSVQINDCLTAQLKYCLL